jgi:hypothetical protein
MVTDIFSNDSLPAPWRAAGRHAEALARELRKEIGPGHVLYGKRVLALARRPDTDEAVFAVDDRDYPLAVVRLSWITVPELSPEYPPTRRYPSVAAWVAEVGTG